MNDYVDIDTILTWPQAFVAIALLLIVIALPQWLTYQQNKATHTTLTKNNGGSSVKDALDRIENTLVTFDERLNALEEPRRGRRRWRRNFQEV